MSLYFAIYARLMWACLAVLATAAVNEGYFPVWGGFAFAFMTGAVVWAEHMLASERRRE